MGKYPNAELGLYVRQGRMMGAAVTLDGQGQFLEKQTILMFYKFAFKLWDLFEEN